VTLALSLFVMNIIRRPLGITPAAILFVLYPAMPGAQDKQIPWTDQEKPIVEQLHRLRSLPDDERSIATRRLALQIRQLPTTHSRAGLAEGLANLATEGDPGPGVLQEVATTLAQSIGDKGSADSYIALAQLVRYEHVKASSDNPRFAAAMSKLEAADLRRESVNFTLSDLHGKTWTLKDLRGKVVLVNFWATWCPPCRKEMPDMEALHQEFKEQGLVILAISDEESDKVRPFITDHKFSYPILLDPGRKVNDLFEVEGIPKSFLYDRNGHLVAQAIDMRTRRQFLEMLALAGLK
jgi:peroxiredoxin